MVVPLIRPQIKALFLMGVPHMGVGWLAIKILYSLEVEQFAPENSPSQKERFVFQASNWSGASCWTSGVIY